MLRSGNDIEQSRWEFHNFIYLTKQTTDLNRVANNKIKTISRGFQGDFLKFSRGFLKFWKILNARSREKHRKTLKKYLSWQYYSGKRSTHEDFKTKIKICGECFIILQGSMKFPGFSRDFFRGNFFPRVFQGLPGFVGHPVYVNKK